MARMPTAENLSQSTPRSRSVTQRSRNSSVGDAVTRLGNTITQNLMADEQARLDVQRSTLLKEKNETDALQLAAARSDFTARRLAEEDTYRQENDQKYDAWDARFEKNIQKHKLASASKIIDPELRARFEAEVTDDIVRSRNTITNRVRDIKQGQTRAAGLESIERNLQLATTPGMSEAEVNALFKQTRATIDNLALTGVLSPEQAVQARRGFTGRFAKARITADIQSNPEEAYKDLTNEGQSKGATGLIKSFEGFRTNAYDDNGTGYRVGYGSDTITRADGSVEKVTPITIITKADAERDLERRIGEFQAGVVRDIGPDVWEGLGATTQAVLTSTAYNYGSLPDDVVNAVKTGDPAAIADAIRNHADDNKGINSKRRNREADLILAGDAANLGRDVPVYYKILDPEDRSQLTSSAEGEWTARTRQNKDASALQKFQTKSAIENDLAQMEETGHGSQLDPTEVATVLGSDDAAKWLEDRKQAVNTFKVKSGIDALPSSQIAGAVEGLKPKAGEADFAARQKLYETAKAYGEKAIAERDKDPAGYVMKHVPHVQKAWQGFDPTKPETAAAAIAATVDAQKNIGIAPENIMPIPAAQAKLAADRIADSTLPVDDRIATLVGMVSQTPDVGQQEQVLRQLAKARLSTKVANVVDAYSRGDMGAARRLFQAAVIDPEKAPKLGSAENKLNAAIEDAMLGEGSIGEAFYGLDMGDPRNAHIANSDMELVKSATRLAMAGGMDQEQALDQAMKDVFGPVRRIDASLPTYGTVRGVVDDGVDKGRLVSGMDAAIKGQLNDVLDGYLARSYGVVPGLKGQDAKLFKTQMGLQKKNLLSDGQWRNIGSDWGFFSPTDGAFVSDADGKPITFTVQQLLDMGVGEQEKQKKALNPAAMFYPGPVR